MTEGAEVEELSKEQHIADHIAWRKIEPELLAFLEERKASRERWKSVQQTAIGTMVVAALGGVGSFLYWLGGLVLEAIEKGQHP